MEKFIFQQKEFLSELYRNCPEHPEIAHFLQNGEVLEKNIARKWIIFEETDGEELQFAEAVSLSDEEYGEICARRRSAGVLFNSKNKTAESGMRSATARQKVNLSLLGIKHEF